MPRIYYRDMDQDAARALLIDAMVMLRDIERNRQMPPTAAAQQQYVALGKRIAEFLKDLKL